jgi:hypothetical protein
VGISPGVRGQFRNGIGRPEVHLGSTWDSGYREIAKADLVLSGGSTLSLEALSLGKKSLIVQPCAVRRHSPQLQPDWWLSRACQTEVSRFLDRWILMPDSQFRQNYEKDRIFYGGEPKNGLDVLRSEIGKATGSQ